MKSGGRWNRRRSSGRSRSRRSTACRRWYAKTSAGCRWHGWSAPRSDVTRFLELAPRIVAAVAALHREGLVHKDLKPENIYVHPATGEVKLAGLGLASQLPRELTSVQPPLLIEGSLPYLSPEQTGRMARAVDNRSDLYSLGIIFYQLLTGRFPFEATDALEWIYCHVARAPPSPLAVVPALPAPLAAMVLKLLAKMPEDRYQTARGLLHDLERCAASLAARRRHRAVRARRAGRGRRAAGAREAVRPRARDRRAARRLRARGVERRRRAAARDGPPGRRQVGARRRAAPAGRCGSARCSSRASSTSTRATSPTRRWSRRSRASSSTCWPRTRSTADAWREPLRQALGIEARLIVDVIPPLAAAPGGAAAAGRGPAARRRAALPPRVPRLPRRLHAPGAPAGAVPRRPAVGRCRQPAPARGDR